MTVNNGGIDIQAQNAGALAGRPDTNDVMTYNFGTAMNPASILPGWTGAAQSVTVKVNPDQVLYGFDDTVTLLRDDGTPISTMGVIDLGLATYVGFYEPGARFLNSTMTMSADRKTVTVVLGTPAPQSVEHQAQRRLDDVAHVGLRPDTRRATVLRLQGPRGHRCRRHRGPRVLGTA